MICDAPESDAPGEGDAEQLLGIGEPLFDLEAAVSEPLRD